MRMFNTAPKLIIKMIYDKDFTYKSKLFASNIKEAFNQYDGFEAIEVANTLYVKKLLKNKDFFRIAHWGITRAIEQGDKITELKYIHATGFHHYKLGDHRHAMMYYAQGIYISEAINNPEFISRFQTRIGEISIQSANYERALDYYFKVLRVEDIRYCFGAYSNLAKIYREKEDYETATDYADKAYAYNLKKGNYGHVIRNLIVVGDINFSQQKLGQALGFYAKALKVNYLYPSPFFAALATIRSADVLYELEHYKEAQATYNYAYEICEEYEFKFQSVLASQKRADTYAKLGDYDKAIAINNEALKSSRKYNFDLLELYILRDKAKFHEKKKEYEFATELLRESEALNIALTEKEQIEKLQTILEEKEKELEFFKTQVRSMASAGNDLRQYAKIIAHDLKEPLRTIGSFTSLLKRKYHKTNEEEVDEYFNFIMDATHRMGDLLDELLSYVVLGIKDKVPTNVDLTATVKLVLKDLSPLIETKNVTVNVQQLPTILGQKQQFRELFYHLIHNAIYHNKSEKPVVNINVNRNNTEYLFIISDNGIGIDADYFEKIFLIFHKLDKQDKEGTGIGLAMCKKIIELHGGSIWINSTVGGGTSIEFTLKDV